MQVVVMELTDPQVRGARGLVKSRIITVPQPPTFIEGMAGIPGIAKQAYSGSVLHEIGGVVEDRNGILGARSGISGRSDGGSAGPYPHREIRFKKDCSH
jgi:hypothetical protein